MGIYEPYVKVGDIQKNKKFTPRPEQRDAIDHAFKYFKKNEGKGPEFLWNAKMRFGKTVCALWLIEKLYDELGKKKVLIVTHRPVVNASWYGDFKTLFKDSLDRYSYGTSKETDDESSLKDFDAIRKDSADGKCVLFFVSMQYLRLSKLVGGKKDDSQDKKDILNYDWDLVIIDEAHEGTQTDLGDGVINHLHRDSTFMLYLSGTPFNLLEKFKSEQIYNWDYIKEQQYKRQWDEDHKKKKESKSPNIFEEPEDEVNPYRELPRMEILTFRLGEMTDAGAIKDAATGEFSFSEFFRVKSGHEIPVEERGKFVHEEQVRAFIKKLCQTSNDSHYPFSNDEYRKCFRHTLWVVPGVKEAQALKNLLEQTPLCTKLGFKVVNVAGNSEDDEQRGDALDKVLKAIGVDKKSGADDSDQTRTITLSCGRLTTGVTVRPWTAVLYLKGSETTAASTYMQTIFRVQSPHTINGMMKSKCYVFDFAPERALTMMAETAKYSRAFERKEKKGVKKQKSVIEQEDKEKMKELLAECPIYETSNGSPLIVQGAMRPIECERLFSQLNSVYVDKVVRNGFEHPSLYNNNELINPDFEDEVNLNWVASIFEGEKSNDSNHGNITAEVNHQELTPEQRAVAEKEEKERKEAAIKAREEAEKKHADKLAAMTEAEREEYLKNIEEKERKRKLVEQNRDKLAGLSKRIPLMMYGANVEDFKEVTIDNFTDKRFIDDESWNEFMPKTVSRELFKKLSKFYNPDIFRDAGVRIRQLALEADSMKVEERIARIAQIFKWFKNPDKETVLTPWEVVNRHMSSTLGGYCFFEDDFKTPCITVDEKTGETLTTNEPRFVDRGDVTKQIFGDGTLGNIDDKAGCIHTKILEINSKTGLYPLYVAYSLYRNLLPVYAQEKGLMADDPEDYSAEDEQAIWDEVVKNNLYVICNTKMAERITRRTLLGFRKNTDGSEIKIHVKQDKLIARAGEDKKALITDLLSEAYWTNNEMNKNKITFNAVVGNPPYQITGGSGGNNDAPIYQEFSLVANELTERYCSLIEPSRWFAAGRENLLGDYRNEMLSCGKIKLLTSFSDAKDIFPSVEIKGGVCYYLYDKDYFGNCEYTLYKNGVAECAMIELNKFNILIREPRLTEIVTKVIDETIKNLGLDWEKINKVDSLISNDTPFGIPSNPRTSKKTPFKVYEEKSTEHDILLFHIENNKRKIEYVSREDVVKNSSDIDKDKVFIPGGYGAGESFPHQILGVPEIAPKKSVCSQSYLYAAFESTIEAQNFIKYLKTRFFRALVLAVKITQSAPERVYRFVPIQDFTNESTINWNTSIEEIEQKLYRKYKISDSEIRYINSMIKPMD